MTSSRSFKKKGAQLLASNDGEEFIEEFELPNVASEEASLTESNYNLSLQALEKNLKIWSQVYIDQKRNTGDHSDDFTTQNDSFLVMECIKSETNSLSSVYQTDARLGAEQIYKPVVIKSEMIKWTRVFINSVKREFDKVRAELNAAKNEKNNPKAIAKISACKDKIKTLQDNIETMGIYLEKVMYNYASDEDFQAAQEYVDRQKNPTLKTVMRGLLGITFVIAGVGLMLGAGLFAAGLTKTVIGAPLAVKLAHVSFTLGVKTIKTGVTITAAATGLGSTYTGARFFEKAITPSTPKDFMNAALCEQRGLRLKENSLSSTDQSLPLAHEIAPRRHKCG